MKFLKLKKTKLIFILCITAFVLIVFGIRKYADPSVVNILSDFLLQSKSISKKEKIVSRLHLVFGYRRDGAKHTIIR